jgi:hypothetical protein
MDRDQVSILIVTQAIMGHWKTQVICAPEPDPLIDIRLEPGNIVELIEGEDDVVHEVEDVLDGISSRVKDGHPTDFMLNSIGWNILDSISSTRVYHKMFFIVRYRTCRIVL